MSYREHLLTCNRHDLGGFRPLLAAGTRIGWVRRALARRLGDFPQVFAFESDAVTLSPALDGFESRSQAMAEVVGRLVDSGDIAKLRREIYPVLARWGTPPLLSIDRGATTVFGIQTFGIHVNGFVRTADGIEMWIGRRAGDRTVAPGKLDNLVGGGQPIGLTLAENLVKEAEEEAGLDPDAALRARPVGAIGYTMEVPAGLKRDVLFNYDLELPADFVPRNQDGEVAAFYRWPLAEVAARVRDTDDFKFNVALVVIDFLIRHGHLTPDEPDYLALVGGLRP